MEKFLVTIKDDDPEWLDEVMDHTMLENEVGIIVIDVAGKKDNVRFLYRLGYDGDSVGYFVSNHIGEISDEYSEVMKDMLMENRFSMSEIETDNDIFNHVI